MSRKQLLRNIADSVKSFVEYELEEGQETFKEIKSKVSEETPSFDDLKKEIDPFLEEAEEYKEKMHDYLGKLFDIIDETVEEFEKEAEDDENVEAEVQTKVKVVLNEGNLSKDEIEEIIYNLTGMKDVEIEFLNKTEDKTIDIDEFNQYFSQFSHVSTLIDAFDSFDNTYGTDLLSKAEENMRKLKKAGIDLNEEALVLHLKSVATEVIEEFNS